MNELIRIEQHNGVDVVDSRLIASELGIQHHKLKETIRKYATQLQEFGVLTLEGKKPTKGSNGGRPEEFYYLNENQATFLMTLSRNTEKVVNLKLRLVTSFAKAKEIITEIHEQPERVLPSRDAVDYIDAASKLNNLPSGLLKQLLNDALIDQVSLEQNLKYLPVAEKPKQYTIVKVRAKMLGYSDRQIGSGTRLGKFVKARLAPAFQEMIGKYPVYHYEICPQLDQAIADYFS